MRALFLGLVSAIGWVVASTGQAAEHPANWSRAAEPFRIIGNVYYVGTEGLSAFLIAGPDGVLRETATT